MMSRPREGRTVFRHASPRLVASALALLGVVASDAASAAAVYAYDQLGRLGAASYDNGACVAYLYDANGNRTSASNTLYNAPASAWGSAQWGCFNWTPK